MKAITLRTRPSPQVVLTFLLLLILAASLTTAVLAGAADDCGFQIQSRYGT